MRRSKSNPAKYARNYRSISQRRMTGAGGTAEPSEEEERVEIDRLQRVLRESEDHVRRSREASQEEDDDDKAAPNNASTKKRKHPPPAGKSNEEGPSQSILSSELVEEISGYGYGDGDGADGGNAENPLVVVGGKKKRPKNKKPRVELTPEEVREARLLQKKTQRKLQQLKARADQKKKRTEVYAKLQETALSKEERSLLASSATLGRKHSKREQLSRLLRKERAGVALTEEEKDLLYEDRGGGVGPADEDEKGGGGVGDDQHRARTTATKTSPAGSSPSLSITTAAAASSGRASSSSSDEPAIRQKGNAAKTSPTPNNKDDADAITVPTENKEEEEGDEAKKVGPPKSSIGNTVAAATAAVEEEEGGEGTTVPGSSSSNRDDNKPAVPVVGPSSSSFAAQMMASLSKLQQTTTQQQQQAEAQRLLREQEEQANPPAAAAERKPRYVPKDPAVLQTAATLGLRPLPEDGAAAGKSKVLELRRPHDIEESRYELPVAQMEFEVMDAVRAGDVTIVCAETGSGKSTQVPQFLYQSGMTLGNITNNNNTNTNGHDFLIGVTQPRRVAAVSTAKRVCYEMGCGGNGNGQSIPNHSTNRKRGNLVAYQTRYETAGLGSDTRIKFMTDGILLQEIRADLLLRKYSVVVLDEAHERNLNTDVLIGLLSAAIPLRRQAAREDPVIVPLKLIIMSATLKVKDFTDNERLFANLSKPPVVVTVPGRTHPVTIHHSRVTELEEYEDVAFRKICKIHRKLPQGGILVFLTGKQEILRMVTRLRRALASSPSSTMATNGDNYCTPRDASASTGCDEHAPRELDDEELDGDLFRSDEDGVGHDDGDDEFNEGDAVPLEAEDSEVGDGLPLHASILPLYSLLSADDQAKVFVPVPEGHRLIVLATNIAETSITIPGINYVVDCGRQKCRNYNAGTGVVSYDVMWISRAAADQRAGRAGRTGPGHCYRLYSGTMYSRHMDSFALPEVLTRPLEDVVLSMKSMSISNVANFPFPTPPPREQLDPALRLLANIGCLDLSDAEDHGDGDGDGDGEITRLGTAVASLPLGVRYAKVLLVAAQGGVLDYAIAMVAALSENSPFVHGGGETRADDGDSDSDDGSQGGGDGGPGGKKKAAAGGSPRRWAHRGGDVLAATIAVGAYAYAGRGLTGKAQKQACRKFCEENGLNPVVMERVHKMRSHLARLARARLGGSSSNIAEGVATKTGGFASSMAPPNKLQERLLCQAIASGFLDNVAMLAPLGSIPGEHPYSLRTAYLSCSSRRKEPLFLDRNSILYSRDSRVLPRWICFETPLRKTLRDGTPIAVVRNVTPIDASWLGSLAVGTRLLRLGDPQRTPLPAYDAGRDAVLCSVTTKFGCHGWEIPSVRLEMRGALKKCLGPNNKSSAHYTLEDSFRWFARFLLEGRVIPELEPIFGGGAVVLNDSPSVVTNRPHLKKVVLLVSELSKAGVDSGAALRRHWAEVDDKFLFRVLKLFARSERANDARAVWISAVRQNVQQWKSEQAAALS